MGKNVATHFTFFLQIVYLMFSGNSLTIVAIIAVRIEMNPLVIKSISCDKFCHILAV